MTSQNICFQPSTISPSFSEGCNFSLTPSSYKEHCKISAIEHCILQTYQETIILTTDCMHYFLTIPEIGQPIVNDHSYSPRI
jgi:hypothetical protein